MFQGPTHDTDGEFHIFYNSMGKNQFPFICFAVCFRYLIFITASVRLSDLKNIVTFISVNTIIILYTTDMSDLALLNCNDGNPR